MAIGWVQDAPVKDGAVGAATKALLVYPRFHATTFWSLSDTCAISGAKVAAPPLGLLTLAALLPAEWDIRLIDCNIDDLSDADILAADIVMTGGMLPQAFTTSAIVARCRALGRTVCVGGPDATSRPDWYADTGADLLVLGEAEGIIDVFVDAWRNGVRKGRFEAAKFQADVTRTPRPRFDLIDFANYMMVGVQFSRGCPFNCEFCDIIELYGRVPRTKTNAQMLAELDHLHALGYFGHVDFHDDNLIGNKKALKRFLPELIAWQRAHKFPFQFSTEASINLADDEDLLAMMADAFFVKVFVGIESGDDATLVAMQKKQNTRRSLADSVHRIYGAGITVTAGFIVGFDTEQNSAASDMIRCIEETSIPICIVGLLTALPNTQLWRRLDKEERLYDGFLQAFDQSPDGSGDQCTAGLNFETLRARAAILRDYRDIVAAVNTPDAFFARLTEVMRRLHRPKLAFRVHWGMLRKRLPALGRLLVSVARQGLLWPFLKFAAVCLVRNPRGFEWLVATIAMYAHVGRFSHYVVRDMDRRIREIEDGTRKQPVATKVAA